MSEIEYTLIREKRKTVSIRIKADLSVEVKAPKAAPRELIDNFVQSKRGWIEKKKQELSESAAQSGKFNFSDGDELLLLGKTRSIASSPDNAASFDDERIYLPKADGEVRREIYRGYLKHLANIHFKARTAHFAKLMGVCPTAVKINFAKTLGLVQWER